MKICTTRYCGGSSVNLAVFTGLGLHSAHQVCDSVDLSLLSHTVHACILVFGSVANYRGTLINDGFEQQSMHVFCHGFVTRHMNKKYFLPKMVDEKIIIIILRGRFALPRVSKATSLSTISVIQLVKVTQGRVFSPPSLPLDMTRWYLVPRDEAPRRVKCICLSVLCCTVSVL